MEANRLDAESQEKLDVTLAQAVESGEIQVRVTDNHDPARPIEGAQVTITDGTTLTGTTDANGAVAFDVSFSGMALFATKTVRVTATKPDGFTQNEQSEKTVAVIAVATIDVNLVLVPQ
jgi:hypothetical protein